MYQFTSKHAPGQQSTVDTAAITALFTDSVAAYVARNRCLTFPVIERRISMSSRAEKFAYLCNHL